jgi:hypothetical protein
MYVYLDKVESINMKRRGYDIPVFYFMFSVHQKLR